MKLKQVMAISCHVIVTLFNMLIFKIQYYNRALNVLSQQLLQPSVGLPFLFFHLFAFGEGKIELANFFVEFFF